MLQRAGTLTCLVTACAVVALYGQEAPPTFRGGVEAVVVDVVVTDKDGNLVRGLTVDDFEVFENGRRQPITAFTTVEIPLERSEHVWPDAEPDVLTNTRPPGRVYMFILDGSVGPAMALRTRHLLRQFFADNFGDSDLAAIVGGRGLATDGQDFTNNRRLLLAAVDKFAGDAVSVDPPNRLLGEVERLRGHAASRSDLRDLQERMEFLARMPGQRKAVVWITSLIGFDAYDIMDYQGGVPGLNAEYAHSAMSAATRGNIRIYPISPDGCCGGALDTAMDFRAVAALTGGFAHINSNNFTDAFERIVQETSTYYIVGFDSSQKPKSGRYTTFDVKVKRPDLQVKARPGVVEPLDFVRRRQPPPQRQSPVAAALGNPVAVSGMPMRVTATPFSDKGGKNATVSLTMEISPIGLQFAEKSGQYEAALEIRHVTTDARNKLYPEFRHPAKLMLSRDMYERAGERGLRVVSEFGLPPGRYQVRVASAGAATTGSIVYDLDVPNFRDGALTMSGVALTSDSAADTLTLQADVGDRVSKGKDCRPPVCVPEVRRGRAMSEWPAQLKVPFAWQDVLPAPPTTVRDFTLEDTITAYVEVYDNRRQLPNDTPYPIDLTTTLRNAEGAVVRTISQQKPSQGVRRPSGGHGFVIPMPLSDLVPGPYLLEVEARTGREPEQAARRRIPIRIQ